jgi:hypothetical protein
MNREPADGPEVVPGTVFFPDLMHGAAGAGNAAPASTVKPAVWTSPNGMRPVVRSLLSGLLLLAMLLPVPACAATAGSLRVDPLAPPAARWMPGDGAALHGVGWPGPASLTPAGAPAPPAFAPGIMGGGRREGGSSAEEGPHRRSPVVAGLLSAIVPGAGQLYNHDRLGYLFLGIEAAGWMAKISMHDTGATKEREFKRYADGHWSWARYRDPNSACPVGWGHSDGGMYDSTLVSLYDTRRDDFYEDIGKIDLYGCGWDDPASRALYRDMRDNSNYFLRNARRAATVIFLNHLVSAFQAARKAASDNQRLLGGTDIDLRWSAAKDQPLASLVVTHRF